MKIGNTVMQASRLCVGATAVTMMALFSSACGGRPETPSEPAAEPYMPPSVPESFELVERDDAGKADAPAEEPSISELMMQDGLVDPGDIRPREEWAISEEEYETIVSEFFRELEMDGTVEVAPPGEELTVPEGFPSDVVLPDGLSIQVVQVSEATGTTMIQGSSQQSMDEVTAYFVKEGHAHGWTIGEQSQQGGPLEQMRMITLSKDGRTMSLNIIESNRFDETQVTLTVQGE